MEELERILEELAEDGSGSKDFAKFCEMMMTRLETTDHHICKVLCRHALETRGHDQVTSAWTTSLETTTTAGP